MNKADKDQGIVSRKTVKNAEHMKFEITNFSFNLCTLCVSAGDQSFCCRPMSPDLGLTNLHVKYLSV
jgi:hypothetical protein